MITHLDLAAATGTQAQAPFEVDSLDLTNGASSERILSFLDDEHYLDSVKANRKLAVVLVPQALVGPLEGSAAQLVVVDDPRWHYYTLHNHLAESARNVEPSTIDASAIIHPSAYIAATGVTIEADVVVEANATILSSSRILAGAIIRAGAVIGTTGFEHKRTNRGVLSVVHDGTVTIGRRSEIGSLTVVAQGFARRHTVLGDDVKIDCNVMVAHGNHVGNRVFIAAGAVLSGSTTIGDDVWIGPGATLRDQIAVGDGARVGIGSVVLRDVEAGQKVLGNPARAHT